jgi:mono/diheme cytochrome c family protein
VTRAGGARWRPAALGAGAGAVLLGMAAAASPDQTAPVARLTNPLHGRADLVEEGRSLFNQYCGHCHAPNAATGDRPRDLRRLTLRYGDDAPATFYSTITAGRVEKGMPPWKGVLSDDIIWRIFTFLETVQTVP